MKKLLLATTLLLSASLSTQAQIENVSSLAPRVTSSYIPRGVTFALGRITVKGKNITQQGFCYSDTNPVPTIKDNVTYENTWNHNGTIYRIEGLKPTTIYYIRAYAIDANGEVGYSDVQKTCTLEESNATYTYNFGGSSAENERIDNALSEAIRYYHKATNIKNYNVRATYNASVPTADCSYGGTIRVGPVESYQATGTLLHEMNHGVGVGQHSRWTNDANLRSGTTTGNWLGTRANKMVQFFDNDETATLRGDVTHMWPYGINGSFEDEHSDFQYTANIMITQALGEDGLPPTNTQGNGSPSMLFDCEQGTKYYLKSECPGLGFERGFLTEEANRIVWKEKTADEVLSDDNFAWYITFDPVTSYYTFQNVATGNYMTVANTNNSNIILGQANEVSSKERFQLHISRKDVTASSASGNFTKPSYWIFWPSTSARMRVPTLQAEDNGGTQTTNDFQFGNRNTNQRWMFLTADEVRRFDYIVNTGDTDRLSTYVRGCEQLLATPHTDNSGTADTDLLAATKVAEDYLATPIDTVSISDQIAFIEDAICQYLTNTTPTEIDKPYDITFLLMNANLDNNTDGWDEHPTYAAGICEYFYEKISFSQKIPIKLPIGNYALHVQGFQRPGTLDAMKTSATNASVSISSKSQKIKNILDGAQDEPLNEDDICVDGKYIPNTMAGAAKYIEAGLYDNVLYYSQEKVASYLLSASVKATIAKSDYWTCFKNFALYYYGSNNPTGIRDVSNEDYASTHSVKPGVYSMSGVLISKDTEAIESLPRGIYVVNGTKVMK